MLEKLATIIVTNLTVKGHLQILGYDFAPQKIAYLDKNGKEREVVVLVGHKA